MDTFEKARRKYEKKRIQQGRPLPKTWEDLQREEAERKAPLVVEPKPQVPVLLAPKEKSPDGLVEVRVVLPGKEFAFVLRKPNVMANINPRASRDDFKNAVIRGLEPLMGRVSE